MVLVVKNLIASAGDNKRSGFNHWVRKIPWRKAQQSPLVLLPGKSQRQKRLARTSSQGHRVGHKLSDFACTYAQQMIISFLWRILSISYLSPLLPIVSVQLCFFLLFLPNWENKMFFLLFKDSPSLWLFITWILQDLSLSFTLKYSNRMNFSTEFLTSAFSSLHAWKKSYDQPRWHIQKQRHYFAD